MALDGWQVMNRVFGRRNSILLETPEQGDWSSGGRRQSLPQGPPGTSQIDNRSIFGLAAVTLCHSSQFLREAVKWTPIAKNDQVLNRNAQVIADQSDKR